jgi:hypothetical protein
MSKSETLRLVSWSFAGFLQRVCIHKISDVLVQFKNEIIQSNGD